ncbi:MAG: hypothetical protein HGA65_06200, partial [Oscillochloris sp.]|nr:hypothetical protein [Oscillochloris sp.]
MNTLARCSFFLLSILFLASALAACDITGRKTEASPSGTLRWGIEGVSDITRLDPARAADYQTNIAINLIFGGLVRLNPDL